MSAHIVAASLSTVALLFGAAAAQAPLNIEAAVAARSSDPTVGAAGIGDPYFPNYGNGGYRVAHYDISIHYNRSTKRLVGHTVITGHARRRLTRFDLDLRIGASAVKVNGTAAEFTQTSHELIVRPAHAIPRSGPVRVAVDYAGIPSKLKSGGLGLWGLTSDGAFVAGEPEASVLWFPANDHPLDKATFDISVTIPTNQQVISNGRLVHTSSSGNQTTWHWRETSPMATYLAYVAIGDFEITRDTSAGGVPYILALSNHLGRLTASARASLALTPDVIDFYAKKFGAYPFAVAGGTVANAGFPFSLETQTRPIYSKVFFGRSGRPNETVIAHELAHQWFGDDVSVGAWSNVWLNEGFATWCSWLWAQHRGGSGTDETFRDTFHFYDTHDPRFWELSIGDPGVPTLFSNPVYERGAMTLQGLQNVVGKPDFYRIFRTWVRVYGGAQGTSRQFEALAERISGRQLDLFFKHWLIDQREPDQTVQNGF
jgi:aminopeptidase N